MIETYPLGIGFKNSGVLRNFSIEIPENLKHFHSNIINITVELGFLGLGCYLWWLITIFRIALETDKRGERDFLMLALGLAIFSWQTAGLVEYNFGDSEVLYIAYALIGLLGAAQRIKSERSED
jgi:O-antigen ligase